MNESLKNWEGGGWVRVDFARQLEQERDEAREAFVIATDQMVIAQSNLREANKERDALVQKLDAWQEIAEHLHYLVQHPAYGVDQAIRRLDVLAAYKHLNNEH
jgi:hypothetical protein